MESMTSQNFYKSSGRVYDQREPSFLLAFAISRIACVVRIHNQIDKHARTVKWKIFVVEKFSDSCKSFVEYDKFFNTKILRTIIFNTEIFRFRVCTYLNIKRLFTWTRAVSLAR